ncbi:hypothetical protein CP082626L3_0267A, partial [Chlamydia psittaci 08-2626_L3]
MGANEINVPEKTLQK